MSNFGENGDHHFIMEGNQQYVRRPLLVGFRCAEHAGQDIDEPDRVTKVPLASKQIADVMNCVGEL